MTLVRTFAAGLVLGLLALLLAPAAPASAHGEQTQEAFLRASTVLLYDVKFSDTSVGVGDRITITGRLRVMDSWPDHTIPEPEIGFLSVIAPGPVFAVTDRRLSGEFTPQSVKVHKGQTFPFSVSIVAREEGRWHVHPSFAVEGAGTLVGRGEWIDVGPGEFRNTAVLPGGGKIDLTNYGMPTVAGWHVIALLIGIAWLVFWLRRPVLSRLVVVAQGGGRSLTGARDVKVGIGFVALIAVVLAGGYVYSVATEHRDPMPPQVARITPVAAAESQPLADAAITQARYLRGTETLRLTVALENTSDRTVTLSAMQIAESTFVPRGVERHGTLPALRIGDGSRQAASVPARERRDLTVDIDATVMKRHNLLPLAEPQVRITGLLFLTDSAGNRQVSEVDEVTSPILPD